MLRSAHIVTDPSGGPRDHSLEPKSPRVKTTHGALTKTLLEHQFVIWNTYIYFIAGVNECGGFGNR